jgi:hypothetical protein
LKIAIFGCAGIRTDASFGASILDRDFLAIFDPLFSILNGQVASLTMRVSDVSIRQIG